MTMNQKPPEDSAFERYDFGPGVTVEGMDGWQRNSASNEIVRCVYVKYDDDTPESDTHKLNFTAVVKGGEVETAWASDNKGQEIGHLPEQPQRSSLKP
jgi:hypothetical protein